MGRAGEAHTRCSEVVVELPHGGGRALMVEIEIACTICGMQHHRFAGHHLRAIRNFLTEVIDRHPDLTLKDGDIQTLEKLQFSSTVDRPEDN